MGGSKLLYLVGTLVLSRLLTPEDFGRVAIATVAITTVMAATDTGMTTALVQATVRERVHYDVAWTIGFLRGLIVSTALLLAAHLFALLFGDERAADLVRLIAFKPLIDSLASPRAADLIRELRFSKLAGIGLSAVVVDLGLSIALAPALGGKAIIVGKLGGAATVTLATYVIAPHRPAFQLSHSSGIALVAFGRWIFLIGLTAVAAELLVQVLIARALGVSGLGLYSLASKFAETPDRLVTEALGAVAFPLYARLRFDRGRVTAAFRAHFVGVMVLTLPLTALVVALAHPLEEFLLGPAWSGASPIIMLLALGFAVAPSFSATSALLKAVGDARRLFMLELLQYAVLIPSVYLLAGQFGLAGVGLATIIASAVIQVAAARVARLELGFKLIQVLRPAVALSVLGVLAGTAAWVSARVVGGAVGVGVGLVVGAAVFVLLLHIADRSLRIGIRESLSVFFPFLGLARSRAPVQ